MCVLMLRGPQTPGELASRAARLHEFGDLAEVETTLNGLMSRDPDPLVARLSRQPGQKESRFAHLLSGEISLEQFSDGDPAADGVSRPARSDRITDLEREIETLKRDFQELREQFELFKKQFE